MLLEKVGLIEVDDKAGWTPELKDVTKYKYNIEIVPTQANTLVSTLDDFGADHNQWNICGSKWIKT